MEDLQQPRKKFTVRDLAQGAIIAAVYALLTIFFAPISSGLIQCRVSEAMSILPYFTFSAVPGLFIGCLLGNLLTGAPIYDVLFGSLATLIAAFITYPVTKPRIEISRSASIGLGQRAGGWLAAGVCLRSRREFLGCGWICRHRASNRMLCTWDSVDEAAGTISRETLW